MKHFGQRGQCEQRHRVKSSLIFLDYIDSFLRRMKTSFSIVPLILSYILQAIFRESENTLRKPYLFEAKITEFCFKKSSGLYVDRDLIWKSLVLDHYLTLITSRSTFNAYCCKILCAYICCNKINFWVDFLLQSSPALANTARYLRQGCLFRFNRAYKKILLPKWIQQFAEKTPE